MDTQVPEGRSGTRRWRFPWLITLSLALAGIGLLLFTGHRAHALDILAYLFLLACPLMHMFMHHGRHGHHHGDEPAPKGKAD